MVKAFKKIFIVIAAALAVSIFVFPATVQASDLYSKEITALDTVVNFETKISAQGFLPGEIVLFKIKKPNNDIAQIRSEADTDGIAEIVFSETETRLAGIYKVAIEGIPDTAQFNVFPGEVSAEKSAVFVNKTNVSANGVDFCSVNVRIVDDFGNPLQFHEVKLASSRSQDRIIAKSPQTDENGAAMFLVSSNLPGISTFTAVDESSAEIISTRLAINFLKSKTVAKRVGGDPETLLLAQAGPIVARFEIDNMPATVNTNQAVSFRVRAVDGFGTIVSTYTGKILFSSTDVNAQLPNSYVFQINDQGQKTFDLGLTFKTAGTQKLTVQQEGNALIKGEKTVEVLSAPMNSGGQVRITKPAAGTYSVNTLEVAGEASANTAVKIYDNGQQIAEVQSNGTGRFSFSTALLADGQHVFQAESNGVQSSAVTITIDSTPAKIDQVDISKLELSPGETTEITVRSDPDLNSVQATIGDMIVDLEADPQNPGLYRGILTAPATDGQYVVDVIVTDKLGNSSPATEAGRVKVDSSLSPEGPVSFEVPSKVTGVRATPGNGKITLSWQPSQARAGIAFYRIYYGTDSANLNLVLNTTDSKTSWYIPNLQNGTTYYFKVVGIDAEGNEGDVWSDMVQAVPSASAAAGTGATPELCDEFGNCPEESLPPPNTPQDGPETAVMAIMALIGSTAIRFFKKKK